jgi:protein required for attachment to host cells
LTRINNEASRHGYPGFIFNTCLLLMKPNWFLIANAAHARVLEQERGCAMVVVETFHHPQSRLKTSELGDDRAGHEPSGHGFGGAAYQPRMDAHLKEHLRFARELAVYLERCAHDGRYGSIAIFASNPFLGELNQLLGPATQHLLSGTHEVDLTKVGLAEIESRIQHELDFAAQAAREKS